jgi:ectoine hydroxylase-related dioxygenase (phytanoyl-CoA dioxygenase family)
VLRARAGSHLSGRLPTPMEADDHALSTAVPVEGAAGTCVVYDARLWHGTGLNVGGVRERHTGLDWRLGIFTLYCAPWARPAENMAMGALPEVVATLTTQQKELLGLRPWFD